MRLCDPADEALIGNGWAEFQKLACVVNFEKFVRNPAAMLGVKDDKRRIAPRIAFALGQAIDHTRQA